MKLIGPSNLQKPDFLNKPICEGALTIDLYLLVIFVRHFIFTTLSFIDVHFRGELNFTPSSESCLNIISGKYVSIFRASCLVYPVFFLIQNFTY